MLGENAGGVIGSNADGAEGDDPLAPVQLAQPRPELPQGNVHGSRNGVDHQLHSLSNIQQHGVVPGLLHRVPGGEGQPAAQHVFSGKGRHIHRVLGGGIGRRIGQFQAFQLRNASAQADHRGEGVDALIDSVPAHNLRAENLLAVHGKQQLEGQGQGAGIVARVGVLHDGNGLVVLSPDQPPLLKGFFILSGGGRRQLEHLRHRRALRAAVNRRAPGDVVGGDAALPIGRTGKRNHGGGLVYKILHLNHVAHGVNVLVRGAQQAVHHNAAPGAHFQPRIPGQLTVGPGADGQNHQARLHAAAAVQGHLYSVALLGEGSHAVTQQQAHALLLQMLMEQLGHLKIQRGHHLRQRLNEGDRKPCVTKVFRHLQADEAAAHHHCALYPPAGHRRLDAVGVGHGPQGHDLF
ncbi:hypothetical protein SDC9_82996 [bioreactor metagenome]|uniref:Uncharacterized protein n=1 Tax=bioreactor metagenome TaxID=1076179 RepID=A0A644Z6E7_9ZZZZ